MTKFIAYAYERLLRKAWVVAPLVVGCWTGVSATESAWDEAALNSGEILLQPWREDEVRGAARVAMDVEASAQAVWDVIVSCDQARWFIDGLEQCQVLNRSSAVARVHQVVRKAWFLPRMDFIFETRGTEPHDLALALESGNLKALQARWDIQNLDGGGARVVHSVYLQPRWPVPQWLVRRTLESDLPDMMACIRFLAGGSLSEGGAEDDRQRCAQAPQPESAAPGAEGHLGGDGEAKG